MVEILVKAGANVNKVSDVGCGEVLTRRVDPHTLYSLSCIKAKFILTIYDMSILCHVHVHKYFSVPYVYSARSAEIFLPYV